MYTKYASQMNLIMKRNRYMEAYWQQYKYGEIFEHDYGWLCIRHIAIHMHTLLIYLKCLMCIALLLVDFWLSNNVEMRRNKMNKIGYFNQKKCNQLE